MGEFPRKEVGSPTRVHRGVQAGRRPATAESREDARGGSRDLDVQPSVIRQWRRRFQAGATAAVATDEDVVPISALREAHQRIRDLERLLGKKQMEIEILQAARDVLKKVMVAQRVRAVTGPPITAICRALGIARQTAYIRYGCRRRASTGAAMTRPCSNRSARSRTVARRMAIAACGPR